MTGVTLPLVVLAGVVSFASPCFLPVVPAFVGYLVGGTTGRGTPSAPGGGNVATATRVAPATASRRAAAAQALVFVAGFTVVFVALWASIGLVGYALGEYRDVLRIVGGAVLVLVGLHVAGLVELSVLYRSAAPRLAPAGDQAPTFRRSALLGLAFGAGWTPCIGPILGGVIGLASVGDSVGRGALLLLAYAAGLGIPFVLVAIGATDVSRRLSWFTRHHAGVSMASGALLCLVGFAMVADVFGPLSGLVPTVGL